MSANRLGLFGGTFDPPHNGHVAALRAAWATGRYDQLLVTVAGDPYVKAAQRSLSDGDLRLQMARAAFATLDGVRVSDMELTRSGATYTIDSVRELLHDGWRVELLLGADAAAQLNSWHEANELAALVSVAIFPRDGDAPLLDTPWRSEVLVMEPVDLSSTQLRRADAAGEDISGLLPPGVISLWRSRQR